MKLKTSKSQSEIYGQTIQRTYQIEERISEIEDKIELDDSSQEYEEFFKVHNRNMQELWDTIKKTQYQTIGINEESKVSGIDQIVNKITEERFPKLKKGKPIQM